MKQHSMSFIEHFRIASETEKIESVARLVKASTGDFDFYMFAVLGISMAAIGLVLDSPEVIIGGMLIAPMLYPLLSLSLALVLVDGQLLYRSARTLLISFTVSVGIALVIAFLIHPFMMIDNGSQVLARAHPSLLYFVVACISGFAATYAMVHTNLNEMLPGVAISVALVPPLAVVGIGLASTDWQVAGGALVLFLLNVIGIALSSMMAFSLMDLHATRKVADSAIRQEERRLEKETERMEEIRNGKAS